MWQLLNPYLPTLLMLAVLLWWQHRSKGSRLRPRAIWVIPFVHTALIPEFPNGFTVLSARGYWRGAGRAGFEASKVVVIVLPGRADDLARLEMVRSAYKRRFGQQSVLEWIDAGCASF